MKKIFQLERKGFNVQYNNENSKFKDLILDEKNVKVVIKNNQNKTINIISKNPQSEFINGIDLLEKIKAETKQNFDLVVISGIPFTESDLINLNIEKVKYKNYKILSADEINNNTTFCKRYDNGILLINTE